MIASDYTLVFGLLAVVVIFLFSVGLARAAKWLWRVQTPSWRIATGQIESATVSNPSRDEHLAEFCYSYKIGGKHYTGYFRMVFVARSHAREFAEAVSKTKVHVFYDPRNPAVSMIDETGIRESAPKQNAA